MKTCRKWAMLFAWHKSALSFRFYSLGGIPGKWFDMTISWLQVTFIVIGLEQNNSKQLVLIIHSHGSYGTCIYRLCDAITYSKQTLTFRNVFVIKARWATSWSIGRSSKICCTSKFTQQRDSKLNRFALKLCFSHFVLCRNDLIQ